MLLLKKNKSTKNAYAKPSPRAINIRLRTIVYIWIAVFLIITAMFIASQVTGGFIEPPTFQFISIILSFSTFVVTSLFSIAIMNHNSLIRDINEKNRQSSEDVNARSESFRTLQFIASNYAVVDFVDNMLISEEPQRYVEELRSKRDFSFYLREDDITVKDVIENFNDYVFLMIKLPIKVSESRPVSGIRLSRFKFTKENTFHRFVPCSAGSNALILYNEVEKRPEVTVNLIAKKTSSFYIADTVLPFSKIKLNLTVTSLLGVSTSGWTELYFTNPQKLEKGGGNKYIIRSSQFKISGLPVLQESVDTAISEM